MSSLRPVSRPAGVARLIAELRAAGELEATGTFTLDRDLARQKIQRFQLTNPARYVLELVQAAVLKGATELDFTIGYRSLALRCDGAAFTSADFEHLYAALWSTTPHEQSRRHLALCVCTLLALDPVLVRIESGDPRSGAFLEVRRGQPDRFGALDHGPAGIAGYTTWVHVQKRLQPLPLIKRFFFGRYGRGEEERLLRQHCQYARFAVTINMQRLGHREMNRPLQPWSAVQVTSFAGLCRPWSFAAKTFVGLLGALPLDRYRGLLPDPSYRELAPTELRLVVNGVWINTTKPAALLPGCVVIANAPQLRQDISHEQVVQDDAYEQVVDGVLLGQLEWLAAGCARVFSSRQLVTDVEVSLLRSMLWTLLTQLGSLRELLQWAHDLVPAWAAGVTAHRLPPAVPEAGFLLEFPLLFTTREQWVSLRRLIVDVDIYGSVAVASAPSRQLASGRPLVLCLREPEEAQQLASSLGCLLDDLDLGVSLALQASSYHEAWQQRRMDPTLDGESFLVRARIDEPGIDGEVGVSAALPPEPRQLALALRGKAPPETVAAGPSRLFLVRDGCLLVEQALTTPVPGLTIVIATAFTPSEQYNGVVGDAILSAALTAALAALVPLFTALLVAKLPPLFEPLRESTLRGLGWILWLDVMQLQLRLSVGVLSAVATAEPPLARARPLLRQQLAQLPLLAHCGPGRVSLEQVSAVARDYGCVPVLVLPPNTPPTFWQDPDDLYQQELISLPYPPAVWQAAHRRAPTIARRAEPPKIILCIPFAELELARALREQLGDLYADMSDWLQVLRAPPQPIVQAAPPLRPQSPAEVLCERVHAELLQLSRASRSVLNHTNLARLRLGLDPSPVAVRCDEHQLLLNLSHPMVKYAVAHVQEPAVVFFVASAVYTAIREWLFPEDPDEPEFHRLLGARACALLVPKVTPPLPPPLPPRPHKH